ncbi:MAG TPA: prepilin-type N-terminal cleavage/methylation domain-containing protein, partial [Acidimicrobiales bacterium]|nr:prepilin-type N-terminal cleavage/methylation domain-containing protein [Acidimicrobiales bacterium]
ENELNPPRAPSDNTCCHALERGASRARLAGSGDLTVHVSWWRDRVSANVDLRTGLRLGARAGLRLGRTDAGFTLLELLIVIVVLGILAAVVIFSLQGVSSSATTAACQSDFATTTAAVGAYEAEMGGYPGGTGTATVTDDDPGTAPAFAAGAAPQGSNAARPGGELLVPGSTSPNAGGTAADGPWLHQAPSSAGSYTIWVANDGRGTVQVLDGAGHVPAGATHTADDCTSIGSGGAATTSTSAPASTTTTSPSPTSTSTSTVPPTTSTTEPPTTSTTTTTAPPTTTTTTSTQAPAFTSGTSTTFRDGSFGSFTVSASGSPAPSLSVSGSLPSGVSFNRSSGVLSGTPRRSGFYRLTFKASNGVRPNATQSFTLFVE